MTVHASRSSGKPRSESTVAHRRKIKLNQASGVSGEALTRWGMSERACAVRHSHILSRKFPPFLGFLSVADRTTNETKCSLYECALREIPRLPVCRSRGTAVARKRQNDLLSGCQNCALTWRAARRKNCRHCASVPVTQTRRNRDRMWECRTAHARSDIPHLVRASPRHPANASRHAKKFRVPLTVLELVKQKIAGPRASGVGSDFVIDDGTGKTLGMVVGVTE